MEIYDTRPDLKIISINACAIFTQEAHGLWDLLFKPPVENLSSCVTRRLSTSTKIDECIPVMYTKTLTPMHNSSKRVLCISC